VIIAESIISGQVRYAYKGERMKKIIVFLALYFIAFSAHAENSLLGKWTNKINPGQQTFEFIKGHDFIHTYNWEKDGKAMTNLTKGVWETGSWTIAKSGDIKQSCNLTIYLDEDECCFDYKFVADNLIMTKKYSANSYSSFCENKVLIREK